jgi:hypothetical protein
VRRIAVAATLGLVFLLPASPAHAGKHHTFVTYNCSHTKIEPARILFACGDGNFLARHLSWSRWHPYRAVGEGTFHQNDCHPDCASGTFHERDGRIVLHGRMWCSDVHRFVFDHVRIRFEKRLVGHRREQFALACPMH